MRGSADPRVAVERDGQRRRAGVHCHRGTLAVLVVLAALAGCAKDPEQLARERAEQDERTWVLLTESQWDAKIIKHLRNAGFAVTPKDKPAPDARYGLTVTFGERVDYCVLNDSEKLASVTYEITNLTTKELILTEKTGGWTGPCFVQWTEVFDDLAEAVRSDWSNRSR